MTASVKRLEALRQVADLEAEGRPFEAACDAAGRSPGTIRAWRRRYQEGGTERLADAPRPGRPDLASLLSDEAVAKIRELVLKCGSAALAYGAFAHDPMCHPEVRERLLSMKSRHALPLSLRRAAHVTAEVQNLHRGEKTHKLNGFQSRRDMSVVLPDGTRRELLPGDLYEMDDMSVNTPFWYRSACPGCGADPLADGEAAPTKGPGCSRLAHRWGKEVGRQSLWAQDVASGKWLGFEFIGRARDAYRAEDILRFCRKTFQTWGLPRLGLRLERGIWRSRRIEGWKLSADQAEDGDWREAAGDYERPEMADTEREVVVGGLAQLGLEIVWAYSPHTKGLIESSFDHLQSIASMMGDK